MSNDEYSPWSGGAGFGAPQPAPTPQRPLDVQPPTLDLPAGQPAATNYQNPVLGSGQPSEPSGWSEPQRFGAVQPVNAPQPPMQFGQRVPYGYGAPMLPEHPNSTLVLVLGIVGLLTNFIAFPFISPIAWYLGAKARRDISHNPGVYSDNGRLTAGLVLGVIGTVLALAFVGFIVMVILVALAAA